MSGRVTDLLLRRGMLEARVWVPALCYVGAAGLLIPGFIIHTPHACNMVRHGRGGSNRRRQPAARRGAT